VLLKRNTSPATVPLIGPKREVGVAPSAPLGSAEIDPLTVDPCCSSLNEVILPTAPSTTDQVPDTSTVTSVRSIQSCFAQPEPIRSVATVRSPMRAFIAAGAGERPSGRVHGSPPYRLGGSLALVTDEGSRHERGTQARDKIPSVFARASLGGPALQQSTRPEPVAEDLDPCRHIQPPQDVSDPWSA
jgi:hypothetical protein